MREVRRLEGQGTLALKDRSIPVTYSIGIYSNGRLLDGRGHISAPNKDLFDAFQENSLQLTLRSGGVATVLITGLEFGADTAPIVTSGPVPEA